MEQEPDYTNVHFMDEYPELERRVRLRRLDDQRRIGRAAAAEILYFPTEELDPDDAS